VHVTSDKMLHGFGSFPGSPWSLSTSKSTGLEPMPLSNQTCFVGPRLPLALQGGAGPLPPHTLMNVGGSQVRAISFELMNGGPPRLLISAVPRGLL
jgi:hypothetical protein